MAKPKPVAGDKKELAALNQALNGELTAIN